MKRSFTGPDRFRLQLLAALAVGLAGCAAGPATEKATSEVAAVSKPLLAPNDVTLHLDDWPALNTPPLDPDIETRIDAIMAKMTLEQKVGQVIQADNTTVTPEDVKKYRLGSVLSGGNSAPIPAGAQAKSPDS